MCIIIMLPLLEETTFQHQHLYRKTSFGQKDLIQDISELQPHLGIAILSLVRRILYWTARSVQNEWERMINFWPTLQNRLHMPMVWVPEDHWFTSLTQCHWQQRMQWGGLHIPTRRWTIGWHDVHFKSVEILPGLYQWTSLSLQTRWGASCELCREACEAS